MAARPPGTLAAGLPDAAIAQAATLPIVYSTSIRYASATVTGSA